MGGTLGNVNGPHPLCPQAHSRAPGLISKLDFSNNRHFLAGLFRTFNVLMGIRDVEHGEILKCIGKEILLSQTTALKGPGLLMQIAQSGTMGSGSLPCTLCFNCTRFLWCFLVFERLGTNLGRGEWESWPPGSAFPPVPSPYLWLDRDTPRWKETIPGHRGHWHVWERFLKEVAFNEG